MLSIKKTYDPINKKLEKYIFLKTTHNFIPFIKPSKKQYELIWCYKTFKLYITRNSVSENLETLLGT